MSHFRPRARHTQGHVYDELQNMPKDDSDVCVCSSSLGTVQFGRNNGHSIVRYMGHTFFFYRDGQNTSHTHFIDSTYKGYHMYLSLSDLLHSCMTTPGSIDIAKNDPTSFLFMTESYSIVYMYPSFLILASVDGHMDGFHGYCWRRKW